MNALRACSILLSLLFIAGAIRADDKADIKEIDDLKSDPFKQYEREDKMRALAKSGSAEAANKLIELLADDYVHIRDAASDILIEMKGDGVNECLVKALAHKSTDVRWRAADVLGYRLATGAVKDLADRLKSEKEIGVREACARALGAIGNDEAKKALSNGLAQGGAASGACARALGQLGVKDAADKMEKLLKDKEWQAVVGALDGFAFLGPDASVKTIAKCESSKDWRVRIAVAQCLTKLTTPEAVAEARQAFAALLKDKDWRVRRRSVEAMLDLWQAMSVELLIDQLAVETTAIIHDIVHALETLTGERKGFKADGWKMWWDGSKKELVAKPKRPAQGWLRAPQTGRQTQSGEGETTTFFDLPVLRQNAAFVFDLSGSMRNPLSKSDPRIPLELAREELGKTLAAMPKGSMFNVCAYRYTSDYPPKTEWLRAFNDGVHELNVANVKAGNDWIAKLEARGWGAFYEALTLSMDDPEVQAIYFLSDGAPSRGAYVRRENLIAALRKAMRFCPVTINTVTISTKGRDIEFMEDIAKEGGGTCAKPLG